MFFTLPKFIFAMEGIDGGLHPAVDGQSLGER